MLVSVYDLKAIIPKFQVKNQKWKDCSIMYKCFRLPLPRFFIIWAQLLDYFTMHKSKKAFL